MYISNPIAVAITAVCLSACNSTAPVDIHGEREAINALNAQAQQIQPVLPITYSHQVYPSESYQVALRRWIGRAGIGHMAWSLSSETQAKLKQHPAQLHQFNGEFDDVLAQLSHALGLSLTLSMEGELAAIHEFGDRPVQITMVKGASLAQAVANLSRDYQWHYTESGKDKSWLAHHDYAFSSHYPIVTLNGDIANALKQVLADWPINAELLYSMNKVFIVNNQ